MAAVNRSVPLPCVHPRLHFNLADSSAMWTNHQDLSRDKVRELTYKNVIKKPQAKVMLNS